MAFRHFIEERMRKGPILKKLRDQFFKAASRVLDTQRFDISLLDDIKSAKGLVVIISPFLSKVKVERFVNCREVQEALEKGIKIIVVTRPADSKEVASVDEHLECIKILENSRIKVIEQPKLHFKSVIIDEEIIYLGSINPLSAITVKYVPPDYMVRFESEALIDEIIELSLIHI